jgi:hypothetical protein
VFGSEWAEPGSIYTFDEASALERMASHGRPLGWWLQHLLGLGRFVDGTGTWVMPVRYARAQVMADLPGGEQLIHSLAFRPVDEAAPVTGQQLHDFCVALGSQLALWLDGPTAGHYFVAGLTYKQINVSYIEQTEGASPDGSGGNAQTLIPTIAVPIDPVSGTDTNMALPHEVALALTLQTDTRGPRTRGRVYLGGLATAVMSGVTGLFNAQAVTTIAQRFGDNIVKWAHDETDWRLNVVSRRGATAREVQGILVGVVPDAQRRRRNELSENYQQAWGNPPGAIPPS